MNENLDLTKILKGCPYGTEFYHAGYGRVWLANIYPDAENTAYPIELSLHENSPRRFDLSVTARGTLHYEYKGECMLFPSKDQRDWSKFTAPWRKKEKFDPKTLQPFDKVLVRDFFNDEWVCDCFSNISKTNKEYPYSCIAYSHKMCIPYNEDTKYLLGINDEAPEYYRYWED